MTALLQAVDLLNRRLVLADSIGQAVIDAAGSGESPAWVDVYRSQVEAIREAAEALECLVRRGYGAQPHVSEAKRPEGYPKDQPKSQKGVAAPSNARRMRSKGVTSRAKRSPTEPSPARPEKRSPGSQSSNQVTGAVDIGTASVHNLVQQ